MKDALVNDLLQAIHSDHYDIDLFKNIFKHANDCNDMMQRNEEKVMIENKFRKCIMKNTLEPSQNL